MRLTRKHLFLVAGLITIAILLVAAANTIISRANINARRTSDCAAAVAFVKSSYPSLKEENLQGSFWNPDSAGMEATISEVQVNEERLPIIGYRVRVKWNPETKTSVGLSVREVVSK